MKPKELFPPWRTLEDNKSIETYNGKQGRIRTIKPITVGNETRFLIIFL